MNSSLKPRWKAPSSPVSKSSCLRSVTDNLPLQLLHDYHSASPGSRVFKAGLTELVAVSIHQIAIILYKLNFDLGNHHDWAAWVAPTSDTIFYRMYPVGKLPTLFFHHQYRNDKQYPQGPADIVGYWAESQISLERLCFSLGATLTSVSLTRT